MPICERCSVSFEQPESVTEVATLRILCPSCMAEYQARKKGQTTNSHPPATERAAAPPSTPRVPRNPASDGLAVSGRRNDGPRPVEVRPVERRSVERRSVSPRPAEIRPTEKRSTERTATGPVERRSAELSGEKRVVPKPAPATPDPVKSGKSVTEKRSLEKRSLDKGPLEKRPGERRTAKKPKKQIDLDELPSRSLKKRGSREIIFGFVSAFLVLAVASFVLWRVLGQKRTEAEIRQARLDEIAAFHTEFMSIDISTVEGAQHLVEFAEENKKDWTNEDFAPDVQNRTANAKIFIQAQEERETLIQRLESVEGILARASELAPSELAEQRRRLEEISAKAASLGEEFVVRVTKDRDDAERAYLDRLAAVATQAAADPALDRADLTSIQQAEDELLKIFETAYKAWQKNMQDEALTARKTDLETRYKAAIALSDEAVNRFFTPEVIESTPWRDLLSPEHAGEWRGATLKGFEYRVADGVLHMIGPDPSEKSEGVISIGDKENWRDFVLDVEFTIVRGNCSIFFRLPPVWQENVEQYDLLTDEGYLEAGRPYTYSFQFLGSTLTDEPIGEDVGPTVKSISWTRIRKGALGLSIPKDSEIKFTRMRIKVLR